MPMCSRLAASFVLLLSSALLAAPGPSRHITTPREEFGFNIGDDYEVANYSQLAAYWKKLAAESDRMRLADIGGTAEGRRQYMAIISSPANMRELARYKSTARRLALAQNLDEEQARELAHAGKAVVWIDGGLHANETVGSQQLIETVYQLVSRTDPETMRVLNDDIVLCVQANPDGQEKVANWYMRRRDPLKRSLTGLPYLYNKYIGHDDNRDFYMSNMPETTNMNRQLFMEWFPQIVYNHHQTGPAGAVIFMPPFRDPFNYNFDPLIPVGIDLVGAAMHSRLIAEGKGGSAMRSAANYSTWWNGGLRTVSYFHNMIGILTEIVGGPTPIDIPLVADKQLPAGDWPLPVAPGQWHYRQSIDYEITNNYAILDLASRYRETFLYNIYRMGINSIEKGSRDNWTVTPKRIEALKAAAATEGAGGKRGPSLPESLYYTVLHDPKYRDARGYIIPSDQPDFPAATKFVNALLKAGIAVLRATSPFQVNGKTYSANSYVVKAAQAFRPQILDMFEPQDHPNDFEYPGGPPKRPYDITGWTLAYQMGVQFDRILDGFDGPFTKIEGLASPVPARIEGPANPAGYLISHRENNSFIVANRLLHARCAVYWMAGADAADGHDLGTGALWVPWSAEAMRIVSSAARTLGVEAYAQAAPPKGDALKLKPVRIGLYDQYGGLIPAGWTRWLLEQFEFPFEVVYPQALDAGGLKSKFDVLVFVDGAARFGAGGRSERPGIRAPDDIPAEYRDRTGRITAEKTIPALKTFVASGGVVLTIGSSTSLGRMLGAPAANDLVEIAADGNEHPLPAEKFYIPGSLLRVRVDNTTPLAYGMPDQVDVFFDNSPVFKLPPDAAQRRTAAVAWFSGINVLDSGWAWGQQYLDGGTAIAEASIGEGRVVLFGPEIAFRAQPHATFKLLFNGLYYGSAQRVRIE